MSRRSIDLSLSALASAAGLLLSWPFFRDFGSASESASAWIAYFVIGYVLAVYVFYIFIYNLRILFEHEHEHGDSAQGADEAKP